MEKPRVLWVISDGRAGNEAQAMALAEALGRVVCVDISVKRIGLKGWAAMVPPGLSHRLGASRKGWPFSGLAEGGDELCWPWPDLVIGAGRRVAPVVAALRQLHGITAVQLLDPKIPAAAFDAVVVPEHDGLEGGNVLKTVGALSRVTPERIRDAASEWEPRLAHITAHRIAVLIGGPSRSAQFETSDELTLCMALETLAPHHGLLITPSRRTRADYVARLREVLGDAHFVWDGAGDNPYPAILGLAEAVIVTEDSVNMASEASSSGVPVHVFPVGRVAEKFARFHESLERRGASRRFTGQIGQWSYEPLAEADRIAKDLLRRGVF